MGHMARPRPTVANMLKAVSIYLEPESVAAGWPGGERLRSVKRHMYVGRAEGLIGGAFSLYCTVHLRGAKPIQHVEHQV